MPHEFHFVLSLPNGLHARPASMFADVAGRFTAVITLGRRGNAPGVDARSVLSMVGLDIKRGDECTVWVEGDDAELAMETLRRFVESQLPHADDAPAGGATPGGGSGGASEAVVPICLRRMNVSPVGGKPVCGGVARGRAVIVSGLMLSEEARLARPVSVEAELGKAREAIAAVRDGLRRKSGEAGTKKASIECELLKAHANIAGDPALWAELERAVRGGATAAQAVIQAAERFSGTLQAAASSYIRERVVDVHDVCMQLLDHVMGGASPSSQIRLEHDSVVFAGMLTANQLMNMDRGLLKGLVLGAVGATSHTVILARSLGIPAIMDVADAQTVVAAGTDVILDAQGGFVLAGVTPEIERYYEREAACQRRRAERIAPLVRRGAVTRDGVGLEVGANASTAVEVGRACERGADGVGLLRTELMFLDRETAPTEEEQFEAYAAVVRAADGRPVIIRTFDIGGDKPAPYLNMPEEENPFLGVRGLRLYEGHPELLRSQLRAILRAGGIVSAGGPARVKIMAPMVATPGEAKWFRAQVSAAQDTLRAEGAAFDAGMAVGVMVEIPAAALVMDQLSEVVDFFSIGTNDLCQYFMAADRGNQGVAGLCNPRQPSFLRLLRAVVNGAKAGGRWIGVCGEMAGDRLHLPLMLGLGVDEISVAPGEAPGLKLAVQSADAGECRGVLEAAMACAGAEDVTELLRAAAVKMAGAGAAGVGRLDPVMVEAGSDSRTKEEAIKEAVDLLYIAGRTERPRVVEEAVWAREETYSTGLGYGFAVPHCKTDAVTAPALVVVKVRNPVEWNSMDGMPVGVVLLLAVPATEAAGGGGAGHMKTFAKLARKLMHEGFRERLGGAAEATGILECLREELEIQ